MKITHSELIIDPSTMEPVIRAHVEIPLSPVVEGLDSDDVALKIGQDFIRDLNELAERDELKTPAISSWYQQGPEIPGLFHEAMVPGNRFRFSRRRFQSR